MDAAEIARRFGLVGRAGLSDGAVARGKQGEVWRLDVADASWAVKVPFHHDAGDPDAAQAVEESTRFHEVAHAAGVPTPAVRRTPSGQVFATVGERAVRLYEWVDLLPPDALVDPAAVGALMAQLHRVRLPATAPARDWDHGPVGAARWDALLARLHEEGAPFWGRLAALRDELVALETWLEPPQSPQLCHLDLWADNLLPTTAGGLCVIDWECSGTADPSHELGKALFEFGRTDPGRARALAQAYRDAGGPGRVDRRGHFTVLIAQLAHITEVGAQDWIEPNPRSPTRADAAAWVGEVLDDPHTQARLTALLEAVAPVWAT